MRSIVAVLLVISIASLLQYTSGTGCSPKQKPIEHILDEECTVKLGDRNVCEGECTTSTQPKRVVASCTGTHRHRYYCKVGNYTTESGSLTRDNVVARSGCSSYTGGGVSYKYVNALTCVCSNAPVECM